MNETSFQPESDVGMTLSEARAQLAKARGRNYWRSLEQLASRGNFQAMLKREMPRQATDVEVSDWDPIDRRDFIRLMGASLALAGLTACTKQHEEKIVPYVKAPEELIPGRPQFYATAFVHDGYAQGVLAESHMGRPTKIEGNPEHPASLGSTNAFAQASILQLYDPDRSQTHLKNGRLASWEDFGPEVKQELEKLLLARGAGFHILTETVTSPTLAAQIKALLEANPSAKWHQYSPVNQDNALAGAQLAFGQAVTPRYFFDKAQIVVSLDADFLGRGPGHIRYARDFMARHTPDMARKMSRLYAVESTPNLTGAQADHKLSVRASRVEHIARALARGLGINAALGDTAGHDEWIAAVVRDLKQNRGNCIVVAGENQPPVVHALAYAMNDALDSYGKTVNLIASPEANPIQQAASIKELAKAMNSGSVQVLLMIGGNPVYNAPADCEFEKGLAKVKFAAHHSLYVNETTKLCQWHISATHYLEEWGDARAFDGTASIIQPLIEPLYGSRSAYEFLSAVAGRSSRKGLEIVQEQWKKADDDAAALEWRRWLHDGIIPGTESQLKNVVPKIGFASEPPPVLGAEMEIMFQPDPLIWDGCFANNAWLQEVPRPLTKLVWDNVILVSAETAAHRRWSQGSVISVKVGDRSIEGPVFVQPGHPNNCATVYLGGGRTVAGRTGDGVGFNAYPIRTTDNPWFATGVANATGDQAGLVTTQEHHSLDGRHIYRTATLAEFESDPKWVEKFDEFGGTPISIYPGHDYSKGNQWGMVINLNACIGCNACVVACQAENNIPVVGKDQVRRGREMHWIRVDRYFTGGDPANPDAIALQPVTCMHCENAPCESVCPVGATSHSADGINQMVYNRCVGTRYCSNNCPYKVRRFNFYKFADHTTPSLKLQRNPDVTVRSRGVMEKCTYCVQRISAARISAQKQNRLVDVKRDQLQTACQQACPTRAITFGDINNPEDDVAKLRAHPLSYGMLVELNTRPRTTYLARVRNPNPELESAAAVSAKGEHA